MDLKESLGEGQPESPPKQDTASSFGESFNPSNASSLVKKVAPSPTLNQSGILKRTMTSLQIKQRVSEKLSSNSHKSKLNKQNKRVSYAMQQ